MGERASVYCILCISDITGLHRNMLLAKHVVRQMNHFHIKFVQMWIPDIIKCSGPKYCVESTIRANTLFRSAYGSHIFCLERFNEKYAVEWMCHLIYSSVLFCGNATRRKLNLCRMQDFSSSRCRRIDNVQRN